MKFTPTPEQKARDLLERMEIANAQNFSSGELVELANLFNYKKDLLHIISQCRKYVDEARLRAEMEHDITNWPLYDEYSVYEEAKECEQLLKNIDKFLS